MTYSLKKPRGECDDKNCPFHGQLPIRGRIFDGSIISDKMQKTVIVRRDFLNYVKKYKRHERRRSQIAAHNPPCINAEKGDLVKIGECRPISKTVSYVVIEKLEAVKSVS